MESVADHQPGQDDDYKKKRWLYTDRRRINTLRMGIISIDGVDYDTPMQPTVMYMGTELSYWTLTCGFGGPALARMPNENIHLDMATSDKIREFMETITIGDTVIELYDEKGYPKGTILRRNLPEDWKGGWTYKVYTGGRQLFLNGEWVTDPQVKIEANLAARDDVIKITEAKINRYERQKKFGMQTTWNEEQYQQAFLYLEALYNMGSAPGFPEVMTYPEVPYFM